MIPPSLLEILACPNCHARLRADEAAQELACTNPATCGLVYPVREGIPVLLIDEAHPPASSGRRPPTPGP